MFYIVGDFDLQARVINKPYDVFGTWYNDNYLLSGNLHLTGPLQSYSSIILNKVRNFIEFDSPTMNFKRKEKFFIHNFSKQQRKQHMLIYT